MPEEPSPQPQPRDTPLVSPQPAGEPTSDDAEATRLLPPAASQPSANWPGVPGYEILGELGQGGMGKVFKARHLQLQRLVAVKMILAGPEARPELVARFRAEAQAVARLQHPHIVQIHEVGAAAGQPFFALEYVDGGTLAARIGGTPLPAGEAARIGEQLARAMHYAHQRGVVHRDLKPANVLLGSDGTPKITDFGLAKHLDDDSGQTRSGAILGTPSYMAPEQAAGQVHQIGARTDVYALGAILYEMLTGRPPFKGATYVDTLEQVRSQEPVAPRRLQPKLPVDLETICLKCLEKETARRYGDAEALAEDLRRFQANQPILARRAALTTRLGKWARRQPALAAALVLLLVVLTSFAVTARLQLRQTSAALEKAEERLYSQRILLAQREWQAGNLGRAESLLQECPASWRQWEWHYLHRLSRGRLGAFPAPRQERDPLVFSPDGARVAGVVNDRNGRELKVWDADSGKELTAYPAAGALSGLTFSPDGSRLAWLSFGRDNTGFAQVGDLSEPSAPVNLRACERILGFSRDGRFLVGNFREFGPGQVPDEQVRVVDVRDGKTMVRLVLAGVNQAAVRADGGLAALAVALREDGPSVALYAWDATGKEILAAIDNIAAALSDDGLLAASAARDGVITLWDARSGKKRLSLASRGSWQQLHFSADGRFLAGVRWDAGTRTGGLQVWELKQGESKMHADAGPVAFLSFHPQGKLLAAQLDELDKFRVFDVATGQVAYALDGTPGQARFSADGRFLIIDFPAGNAARVFEATTGKEVVRIEDRLRDYRLAAVHVDRQRFALARHDWLKIVDADGMQEFDTRRGIPARVRASALCPEAPLLAVGLDRVQLWDLDSGRLVAQPALEGPPQGMDFVALSRNGRHVVAGALGTLQVWNVGSGEVKVHRLKARAFLAEEPGAVAVSPDGAWIAMVEMGDGVWLVKVLRADTGEVVHALPTPGASGPAGTAGAFTVAFSPDGQYLAVGAKERSGDVRIWRLPRGDILRNITGAGSDKVLLYSPDGRRLVSGKGVYDIRGRLLFERDGDGPAAFSPDGARLAEVTPTGIKVRHAEDGQIHLTLAGGSCWGLVFSPDGKRLWGLDIDGSVKTWDATPVAPLPLDEPAAARASSPWWPLLFRTLAYTAAALPVLYLSLFFTLIVTALLMRGSGQTVHAIGMGTGAILGKWRCGSTWIYFAARQPLVDVFAASTPRLLLTPAQLAAQRAGLLLGPTLLIALGVGLRPTLAWDIGMILIALNAFVLVVVGPRAVRQLRQVLRSGVAPTTTAERLRLGALRGVFDELGAAGGLYLHLLGTASAWTELGERERAEQLLNEADALPLNLPWARAAALLTRARIAQLASRFALAEKTLAEVELQFTKLDHREGLFLVAQERARLHCRKADAADALDLLEALQAHPVVARRPGLRTNLLALRIQAQAALGPDNLEALRQAYEGARAEVPQPARDLDVYHALARRYLDEASWPLAEAAYRTALAAGRKIADTLPSPEDRALFARAQDDLRLGFRDCLQRQGKPPEETFLDATFQPPTQSAAPTPVPKTMPKRLQGRIGLWLTLVNLLLGLLIAALSRSEAMPAHEDWSFWAFMFLGSCALIGVYVLVRAGLRWLMPPLSDRGHTPVLILALVPWMHAGMRILGW